MILMPPALLAAPAHANEGRRVIIAGAVLAGVSLGASVAGAGLLIDYAIQKPVVALVVVE